MQRILYSSACIAVGLLIAATMSTDSTVLQAQSPVQRPVIAAQDSRILLKLEAILASERPGIVEAVLDEEGVVVQKDQEVARLKDGVTRATLAKEQEKARNDVQIRFAQKSSEVADKELEISASANKRLPGTVPEVEMQKLYLASEKARLQIEQAQFEMKIAVLTVNENEETLKTHQVVAPFSGTVSKIHRKRGEAVKQGDPILEIVNADIVKIEGFVTAAESYRIRPGDKVEAEVKLALPEAGGTFPGVVKFIEPRVDVGGRVKIVAEVQNPAGILRAGLEANMRIFPEARPVRTQAKALR